MRHCFVVWCKTACGLVTSFIILGVRVSLMKYLGLIWKYDFLGMIHVQKCESHCQSLPQEIDVANHPTNSQLFK